MNALPFIPKDEFKGRQLKIQAMMEKYDIDILFFYGDDKAVFGANHSRWLLDYAPHFEPICIGIPRNGDIHVATGAESEAFFLNYSKNGKVHVVNEFNMPEEEYPYTKPINFLTYLKVLSDEVGKSTLRVGIVGESQFPNWLYKLINVENFQIINTQLIENEYRDIRASKTPTEMEVIRYAFKIAEEGFKAGYSALKEGVSERDVAAEIEYKMRKMGSEGNGIDTIVGFGKKNTYPILTRTTFNTLKNGDLALLTIAPRFEGYHGVIARPVCFGSISNEIKSAIQASIEASNACCDALKVGATGKDVAKSGLRVLDKHNLLHLCVYSGIHSVGLSEFEPPILTSYSEFRIPENFVVSIDVPLFFTDWGGLRVETGYLVTNEGIESLTSIPLSLIEK